MDKKLARNNDAVPAAEVRVEEEAAPNAALGNDRVDVPNEAGEAASGNDEVAAREAGGAAGGEDVAASDGDEDVNEINVPGTGNAPQSAEPRTVTIMYENQMHSNYKQDEKAFRNIINTYVKPASPEITVKCLVYYKTKKVSDFLIKNNLSSANSDPLSRHDVVYEYKCTYGECVSLNHSYIGYTRMCLRDRMYYHRYNGSIFKHFHEVHGCRPPKDHIYDNTKILYQVANREHIAIVEALHIYDLKPTLNDNTVDLSAVKLFNRR